MATIKKDIGAYSAYAIAVKHGYKGTEAEWVAAQEKARVDSEAAAKAAKTAQEAAEAAREQAQTAKTSAETAQGAAAQAAQTATVAAGAATQAAQAAQTAKEAAEQAQTGAQNAKTGAETAKTEAQTAQTAAEKAAQEAKAAQTGAVEAKTGAVEAQGKAEEAAQGVAADREQIGANKSGLEAAQQELSATKEQLTETKAALATTQKDLAKAQRAIKFQAELNQGQTWDFETDDQEAYRRQVPSGAKAGAVMAVGGKTVAWNQLCNALPNHGTYKGVNVAVSNGKVSLNGTATDAMIVGVGYAAVTVSGHKYMATGLQGGSKSTFYVQGVNENNGYYDIVDSTAIFAATGAKYRYNIIAVAGTVFDHTFQPMVINLTLMFGSGKEPTDTSDPRISQIEAYAAAHPEYNAGELLSALVDEARVMGRNICDLSFFGQTTFNGITLKNNGGLLKISGTCTNTGQVWVNPSARTLPISGEFICKTFADFKQDWNNVGTIQIFNSAGDSKSDYGAGAKLDFPDRKFTLCFRCIKGVNYNNTIAVMICDGKTPPTAYSPYHKDTYPIPDAVKQLPGYGWSAGSVANTIERTENGWQYVQRVGSVDLGELSWSIAESVTYGSKYFASNSIVNPTKALAFLAAGYTALDSANVLATDMSCWITFNLGENGRVIIRDDKYTDVASFKTAMSGKPLYYELATPITTDITALMGDSLAPFAVEAGGSITMHHPKADEGFAIDVPAKIQYITKLSEVSANG